MEDTQTQFFKKSSPRTITITNEEVKKLSRILSSNRKHIQYKQKSREMKKNESEESHEKLKGQNRQDIQNFRDRKKGESEESYLKLKEQNR